MWPFNCREYKHLPSCIIIGRHTVWDWGPLSVFGTDTPIHQRERERERGRGRGRGRGRDTQADLTSSAATHVETECAKSSKGPFGLTVTLSNVTECSWFRMVLICIDPFVSCGCLQCRLASTLGCHPKLGPKALPFWAPCACSKCAWMSSVPLP